MTPAYLARSGSEDAHQMAIFCWANMARLFGFEAAHDPLSYEERGYARKTYGEDKAVKQLALLFSVPNGGKRNLREAAKLKATGVLAGYPDIALDVPTTLHHGLRIELKKKGGVVSSKQKEIISMLLGNHYLAVVCVEWEAAVRVIEDYLT